ncbi:response regulator transcription factor [Paenibacillus anaericanus]|uniref:Response regulator transcription factor n=1 Tax=Paenibacillus anaericanus TaxID=170367 RepID=A0A3S1BSN7_9BACL|nr:response regulator transcription factor [Paenibacillus anaericanus]RUT46479.1 response regulator transcription factor [Paenibacillus anaericanus]
MIKVLIVDDEPKLREGLRSFIDWESLGYTVVDTAANGNEALVKFEQYKPDLVLADIRMPGMNGLQLIQKLREIDTDLHILILSGYADFDYAKQAITHRADGYLLKPVDEDELISYLNKIKTEIQSEQVNEQWRNVTKVWTREALILSVLSEPKAEDEDATVLSKKAEELGLLWKHYQVLLISVQSQDETDTKTLTMLKRRLMEAFEDTGRGWVFYMHSQMGVLLKEPLLSVEREAIYKEIESLVIDTGDYFSVALGQKVSTFNEIGQSYSDARELIKLHFFLDNGMILCADSLSSAEHNNEDCVDINAHTFSDQIYYALDIGNQEVMKSLVHRAGQFLVSEGYNEMEIKRRFAEILTSIHGKVLKQSPELQSRSKEYADYLTEIYGVRTIRSLFEKIDFFLLQMMNHLREGGKQREVKIMLDLINRNFGDNLKLETLSSVLNYNSAYLGKLFKNETGEYFNTYLDKVRMEKAKALLEEGFKVYQVAEKVGYTNVDYFHSKFRKYVGTSPSAYRKEVANA